MTSRRAPVLSRLLREEEGGFLVEILVSAVILVAVALGVVATFDTSAAQSGQQRAQAVASNLAASELERLRSLRFDDLAAQTGTEEKTVAGVVYTVATEVDQTGTPAPAGGGCETASRSAEALRATATVTWPTQGNQRPVRVTSLVAAPANASSTRGTVIAQVVNSEGFGVPGLAISLTGASSVTATTDSAGCARFTDLLAGPDYHLTFSRPGWVDPLGRNAIDERLDVVAGETQTKSFTYEEMGTAVVSFYFTTNGLAGGTRAASPQLGATWSRSTMAVPKTQTVSPAQSTLTSPLLPVGGAPYAVNAGACASTYPALFTGAASVPSTTPVEVRVPTIRVTVQGRGVGGAGNSMQNASSPRIFVTSCGGRQQYVGSAGSGSSAGVWTGGAPYSSAPLSICADGTYNGSKYIGNATLTPLGADGIASTTITMVTTTANPGTC